MYIPPTHTQYICEIREKLPRNYMAHSVDLGLYFIGLLFVSMETVLPPFMKKLGASDWMVAILPLAFMGSLALPTLFSAHRIERLYWKKPMLCVTGLLQRLPYLASAATILFFAEKHPGFVLAIVLLTPFVSGVMCGIGNPAWMDLIAKTIPSERRASLSAAAHFITAIGGLAAGGLVMAVLNKYSGFAGYSILYFIAFGFLMLSYCSFLMVRETRPPPPPRPPSSDSLTGSFKRMYEIISSDTKLRKYLLARTLVFSFTIVVPFIPIHALSVLGLPEEYAGTFISFLVLGVIAGTLVSALAGDYSGGRLVMIISRTGFIVMCLVAAFAYLKWQFLLVFFIIGFSQASNMVGVQTFCLDMAPESERPTYLAMITASNFPALLCASALSIALWSFVGNFRIISFVACGILLLSLIASFFLEEPRRENIVHP